MAFHDNASAPPPIDYSTQMPGFADATWRLLRLAIILWASLVLLRHATYWTGVAMDGGSNTMAVGGARVVIARSAPTLPWFPEVEALMEACVLVAALVVAATHSTPRPMTFRLCRLLGMIFVVLVAADYLASLYRSPPQTRAPRELIRAAWQLASKAQLLVVPILCMLAPLIAMSDWNSDRHRGSQAMR